MTAPIALTMGDPAGIGPELSIRAWQELREEAPFFLIGDVRFMESLGASCVEIGSAAEAKVAFLRGLPVLNLPLLQAPVSGHANTANARVVIESIERAVELVMHGEASALVTNPIAKKVLKDGASFAFPGHTEFLAHLGGAERSVMMLAAPALRVVPVTIHIPLSDVPAALTTELLRETLRITHASMISDLGIPNPRICVAGLNPHAGEGGSMGREDIELITPVLEELRREGLDLKGPLSADTMFHPAARASYDVAVCMYHDQALIPIKTLDFEHGVNATLGLPFIRTSPDHGTAFDIAGKGIASPASLIAALRMARDMAGQRALAS